MSEYSPPTDWRNINVFRNRKYETLVERLCSRKTSHTGKPIFEFNKDLMVFAAMVGFTYNRKEAVEKNSIQISLGTYASDEKDGYIYLLALLENKDMCVLKEENIRSGVNIFEEYCNGGLAEISSWIDDNPGDIDSVDTLADKIYEHLLDNSPVASVGNRSEVEF